MASSSERKLNIVIEEVLRDTKCVALNEISILSERNMECAAILYFFQVNVTNVCNSISIPAIYPPD